MIREILRKQSGFSLIELILTMTVFVIAIAVASSIFVPMLTQFKQQSKVAESQVERLVGLDILRKDLEQAGYGLPWIIPAGVNYNETIADAGTGWVERDYNDGPPAGPNTPVRGSGADIEMPGNPNPPGAIRNGNNNALFPGFPLGTLNNSDVLVIKATSIAINDAAVKWTYVMGYPAGAHEVNMWGSSVEDLNDGDRAIVMVPMRGVKNQRQLVADPGAGFNFSLQFNSGGLPNAFVPSTDRDVFLIYGVDPDTNLRMPFNRADYYVERPPGPAPDDMPPRCAQNTGILYKGVVNQTDGNKTEIRLIECVADMQLAFALDTVGDGIGDTWSEYVNNLTAAEIRNQLKEVRVYILAHEGQRDQGYNFNGFSTDPLVTGPCGATCVMVGEVGIGGEPFDLSIIPDYQDYRWKVYKVVVKPANLGAS